MTAAYLADPDAITAESFRRIDAMLAPYAIGAAEHAVVRRVVHAAGDVEYAGALRFSPGAVARGVAALRAGATIVADVRMVASGIRERERRELGCPLVCALDEPGAAERARERGTTRSMAGIELAHARLPGAVFVIGNAPTALLRLLELARGAAPDVPAPSLPALVVGVPVGFVATVESKTALMRRADLAWIANVGTKGGSAVAAAIANALLIEAAA